MKYSVSKVNAKTSALHNNNRYIKNVTTKLQNRNAGNKNLNWNKNGKKSNIKPDSQGNNASDIEK